MYFSPTKRNIGVVLKYLKIFLKLILLALEILRKIKDL